MSLIHQVKNLRKQPAANWPRYEGNPPNRFYSPERIDPAQLQLVFQRMDCIDACIADGNLYWLSRQQGDGAFHISQLSLHDWNFSKITTVSEKGAPIDNIQLLQFFNGALFVAYTLQEGEAKESGIQWATRYAAQKVDCETGKTKSYRSDLPGQAVLQDEDVAFLSNSQGSLECSLNGKALWSVQRCGDYQLICKEGDYLYFASYAGDGHLGFLALDKEGNRAWQTKTPAERYFFADNRLYWSHDETLFGADPLTGKVIASYPISKGIGELGMTPESIFYCTSEGTITEIDRSSREVKGQILLERWRFHDFITTPDLIIAGDSERISFIERSSSKPIPSPAIHQDYMPLQVVKDRTFWASVAGIFSSGRCRTVNMMLSHGAFAVVNYRTQELKVYGRR